MSPSDDLEGEMQRFPLDPPLEERLLAGRLAPEDASPGYAELAELLASARSPARPDELTREAETVARMAETLRSQVPNAIPTRGRTLMRSHPKAKAALAFVVALLAATTGAAFAGSLPAPAQSLAASVLERVGLDVQAEAEQERAEARHAAAMAYAEAVQAWTDCVAEAASSQGDESARTKPFDPERACGEHPRPQDFGLAASVELEDLPEEAQAGQARAEEKHAAATAYAEAVHDWTACVATAASSQGGEELRQEDFSPEQACGAHPSPSTFGLGGDEGEEQANPDVTGPPENSPPGSQGRGRPGGRPSAGPPADAGPPPEMGPPGNAGPPNEPGPPADAGPPPETGPPGNAGPPKEPGPPADAGPPAAAGE
jgi:hypothetical protein